MVLKSQMAQKLRKIMICSFCDLLILARLKNGFSMSCDDIIKFINRKFGVMVSPGTVYAHLYSLEQNRLLNGYFNRKKYARVQRVYKITERGKQRINEVTIQQNTLQDTISEILKG